MNKILSATLVLVVTAAITGCKDNGTVSGPVIAGFDEISVGGELESRLEMNMNRLEESKFQPGNVFLTEEQSGGWPGDTEGRTILGLVFDARALNRTPKYLEEIIDAVPAHLNSLGYMGPEYGDDLNEQQLSGNGWLLRGLCAYYDWKKDERALGWIKSISENLYVRGKGLYSVYPIDPALRAKDEGAPAGSISDTTGHWMLSTDIGCVFIGMEGLIDAYRLVGTPEMKEVIDEMLGRFLEMDILATKAQTHSSLTACRGLVRYAEIMGDDSLIAEVEKRYDLYRKYGMTENYENYNWFRRYDTWAESCAIIDSYMLALQLWSHTGKTEYLRDAQLIYFNAICHVQRFNGGFGCDSCPGEAEGPDLYVKIDEAHWCCTMRGGEGLGYAALGTYMREGNTLYVTCFRPSSYHAGGLGIEIGTDYPEDGCVSVKVNENRIGRKLVLKLFIPDWIVLGKLSVGEEEILPKVDEDGFLVLDIPLKAGDVITLDYQLTQREEGTLNSENTEPGDKRRFKGPLILSGDGTPIYHLMDSSVTSTSGYTRQIIF